MQPPRLARPLAVFSAIAHVLGLVVAAFVMTPGSFASTPRAERVAYLADHPLEWKLSWVVWMFAAVGYAAFVVHWASSRPSRDARIALWLAIVAASIDLACDVTWLQLVPAAARAGEEFDRMERIAFLGGVAGANTLYALGVLFLGRAIGRHRVLTGVVTAAGLALTVAAVAGAGSQVVVALTGVTILSYTVWVLAVAFR